MCKIQKESKGIYNMHVINVMFEPHVYFENGNDLVQKLGRKIVKEGIQ